jgi:hypothetical protein
MEILRQFLVQTPFWVWFILVWLVMRGVAARRPGETTLTKMAIIPLVFTAWGLYDLVTLYGATVDSAVLWLAGITIGSAIGWWIVGRFAITVDHTTAVFQRPADLSLLPLLLATFAVKYGFGVIAAISPQLIAETAFRVADLMLSGAFTGIFVGKFLHYIQIWRTAREQLPRMG